MKTSLLSILFTLTFFSVAISPQTIAIILSRIDIGTPRNVVVKKLGKPFSGKINGEISYANGKKLVMKYAKATFEIMKDKTTTDLLVASVSVISEKWSISGVKIGTGLEEVRNKVGIEKTRKESFDFLGYLTEDVYANFSSRMRN